jgi:hypothetical protein
MSQNTRTLAANTSQRQTEIHSTMQLTTYVFHAKAPSFGMTPIPATLDHYVLAAELKVTTDIIDDALEQSFQLTNNIEDSWTLNAGVTATRASLRSTSVGDIVCIRGQGAYRCEGCGWDKLGEFDSLPRS